MTKDIVTSLVDSIGQAAQIARGREGAGGATALQEAAEILTVPRCTYPKCRNTRRTRGLCHQHYQTMRSYVRDGKATEVDLEARGLLLDKGTGGSPVQDHSAFLLGSSARGEA